MRVIRRERATLGLVVFALLTLGAGGCATPPVAHDRATDSTQLGSSPRLEWVLEPNEDLTSIACICILHDAAIDTLVLSEDAAWDAIVGLQRSDGGPVVRNASSEGGVSLPGRGADLTLRYRVDLTQLAAKRGGPATRVGKDILVSVRALLLHPPRMPESLRAIARVRTPSGMAVSTPWPELALPAQGIAAERSFALDADALWLRSFVAFGRFVPQSIAASEAVFDVVVLDANHRATAAGIERWIRRAAGAVAGLFGQFPAERAQIVVKPTGFGGEPVVFGMAFHGGGPAAVLYLGGRSRDADLDRDWVAVHELTHLGLPAMPPSEGWLAEGWVMLYTEILRARAGFISETECFRLISDGVARGRRSGVARSLRETSQDMDRLHAYDRVYWGGAATALLIDQALRADSAGRVGLDDAMRSLWRCCASRFMSADEAVAALDAWYGKPLISATVAPLLDAVTFPDLDRVWRDLGVTVAEDGVQLDSAPEATRRRRLLIFGSPADSGDAAPVPPATRR